MPSCETGSSRPKIESGSTLRIPFGPPATFSPKMLSLLFETVRKIWKKKSVTIAR